VRPPRADIAVPPFPPDTEWIGTQPQPVERLAARGPVLVHFFEIGEPSGVRTLHYLRAWEERYRPHGLAVLGVHSPGFPFSASSEALAAGLSRLGLRHPVANDRRHRIWHDYGCRGWPSLFLWGRGGALRWYHFGEGAYRETEEAIRAELGDSAGELPERLAPLRPTDVPDARLVAPSPEVFPGGSRERPWSAGAGVPPIELDYAAGAAYATVEGEGELRVTRDGAGPTAIPVEAPGLHELAVHERHGAHRLRIEASEGIRVWSVSFSAGPP
jgi:hypothetical protein